MRALVHACQCVASVMKAKRRDKYGRLMCCKIVYFKIVKIEKQLHILDAMQS